MHFISVYVTVKDSAEAEAISQTVVEERLSSCANILGSTKSIYYWNNKLCNETEVVIIFKTKKTLFEQLKNRIVELHSYQVPCIVAWDICEGHPKYLDWVGTNTI